MKKVFLLFAVFAMFSILLGSCKKDESTTGKVIFWTRDFATTGIIGIEMEDGTIGFVEDSYVSLPDCGSASCFTFEAPAGTYHFDAATGDKNGDGLPDCTWSATITITAGKCSNVLFTI